MKFQYLTPPTIKTWKQIGQWLFSSAQWFCTVAYKGRICTDLHEEGHHGIWGGDYSKRKLRKKFTDVLVNYQPSCHNCNYTRKADREENRRWNIRRQYEAGFDVMAEFEKLPKKYRDANKDIERMIRQEAKKV